MKQSQSQLDNDNENVNEKKEDLIWACSFKGCTKSYTKQSSLYNHIRIKHTQSKRNDCIKYNGNKKIGRPRKYFPPEQENIIIGQNFDDLEFRLRKDFYTNPLWMHLVKELRGYILSLDRLEDAIKNKNNHIFLTQLQEFVKQLKIYQEDYSTSKENIDYFILQLDYFSRNLDREQESEGQLICRFICLVKLIEESDNESYYQEVIDHLTQFSIQNEDIAEKVCQAFDKISSYGVCKYKTLLTNSNQQEFAIIHYQYTQLCDAQITS